VSRLPKLAVPALFVVAALVPTSAEATYPGQNGKIYFHACDEKGCGYDIYAVNADGTGLENVTDVVTDGEELPEVAFEPSVSADGKRMAFGVDSQATSEIWIMSTDGTEAHQLTHDNLLDQKPAISPDGSRIVWNQWSPYPEYTDRDIWTMNADGSGQELLFNGSGEDIASQFTPDGQTVVMSSETGDMDIRKIPSLPAVPPLTEAVAVAADDELLESDPSVSPDGSTVAFTQTPKSMSFGPFDIYSVGINGGPTTPLFATSASETSPAYSPDGTKIVFNRDGVPMIGNADGSGTPVPLELGTTVNSAGGFDWAPAQAKPPVPPGSGDHKDIEPPQTRISKGPKRKSTSHRAVFRFSSNEANSTFKCKLDRKKFTSCRSPKKYKGLKEGTHTFSVFAIDPAGNRDQTPAKRSFKILSGK
jgi:dipeptidyl aminopeptidase/acylaminoacyl peptidase